MRIALMGSGALGGYCSCIGKRTTSAARCATTVALNTGLGVIQTGGCRMNFPVIEFGSDRRLTP